MKRGDIGDFGIREDRTIKLRCFLGLIEPQVWRNLLHSTYSFVGIGGYCSNLGIAGSIWSHGCASETKISICDWNQLGSSREPARIPTNCGSPPSNSPPVIRDPHSGQKPRLCFPRAMLDVKW